MIELEGVRSHVSLSDFTTLGLGGPAAYLIEVQDISLMQRVLALCSRMGLPHLVLGKGSNVLFEDRGFSGIVIVNRISFFDRPQEDVWHVGAGYSFSLLGVQTARQGWAGLEFASGIPGSVGGAVFMNAGASGGETAQTLVSVDFVASDGRLHCLSKSELTFGYRHSSFQGMEGAIVGASFRLSRSMQARQRQLEIVEYRTRTQPYDAKSAGCAFRNPPSGSAGALIEQSALKGRGVGGAQVSNLHANFLVNAGAASSAEMLELIRLVQFEVKRCMGAELELEIRCIPYE